jgi:hypothetical protein
LVALYVYYRIDPGHAADAEAALRALLARLGERTGIHGEHLKKCDEPLLWMEVYRNVADRLAFEVELAHAVTTEGLGNFILGARHVECFASQP